jgi:hypothetical protein
MKSRRQFIKSVAVGSMLTPAIVSGSESRAKSPAPTDTGREDRRCWVSVLEKLATPVLGHLAERDLKRRMPVEASDPADRRKYTHLEAFARLLAGIAPWLEVPGLDGAEAILQKRISELTRLSLDAATDLRSPDFMNYTEGGQPLVDSAFLAQGILRAPRVLWDSLGSRVRRQLVAALKSSRAFPTPAKDNWVLFAATVEAALFRMGEPTIEERLEGCLRSMLDWYKGDGVYGDGDSFHFDYYNSFVIHPMLVDVLAVLRREDRRFEPAYGCVLRRARRYAEIQERLIAPDGTYPALGRSIAYRFGAFQCLAQMSLMRELPAPLKPAQVRAALTAVIRRMIGAPGTFDEHGWLRIGFCGHQPTLGERYISTGSLYLCSSGLLPLGLPPADEFWSGPPARWTSQQLWSGDPLSADHALSESGPVEIPVLNRDASKTPS